MTLKPETKTTVTLIQWVSVISFTVGASVWANTQFLELKEGQSRIETFIKHEAVTQRQATLYAAEFRWENRDIGIIVPEVSRFKDPQ